MSFNVKVERVMCVPKVEIKSKANTHTVQREAAFYGSNDSVSVANYLSAFFYNPSKKDEILGKYRRLLDGSH